MFLFIDINETLIRTGRLDYAERLAEQQELERFVQQVARLGAAERDLKLVLLTGNSFEYSRRVEEPLGLKDLPGVSVIIVSENGLLARDLRRGDLWRLEVPAAYRVAAQRFVSAASTSLGLAGRFVTQGNEARVTLKPVAERFEDSELTAFEHLATELGTRDRALLYLHRFYADLDPLAPSPAGGQVPLAGKDFAVERLTGLRAGQRLVAIGDSASDLPMFDAVRSLGGRGFLVANSGLAESAGIARTHAPFTAGVNEVLASLLS